MFNADILTFNFSITFFFFNKIGVTNGLTDENFNLLSNISFIDYHRLAVAACSVFLSTKNTVALA